MVLDVKPHQESYEGRSYALENPSQGRDNVFRDKIGEKNLLSPMCLEVKMQKSKRMTNLYEIEMRRVIYASGLH